MLTGYLYRATEHRVTLSCGDYIEYRDGCVCRLNNIFTHEVVPNVRRLFATITPTIRTGKKDDPTGLTLLQLGESREIVGLSMMRPRNLYILPIMRDGGELVLHRRDGEVEAGGELLYVDWNLQFL